MCWRVAAAFFFSTLIPQTGSVSFFDQNGISFTLFLAYQCAAHR